jgi:hypothetical protein
LYNIFTTHQSHEPYEEAKALHIPHWVWALVALTLFGTVIAIARRKIPFAVRLGTGFEVGLLVALFLPFTGAMYLACKGFGQSAVPAQLLWLLTVIVGVFVAISFARTPRTIPFFAYTLSFVLAVAGMSGSILEATTPWSSQVNVLGIF